MNNKINNNIFLAPQPKTWYEVIYRIYEKPATVITFQVTEDCCMACTYCYQHNKSPHKMTFETAKYTIDKILNDETLNNSCSTLVFEFIGGEPLLEIDLIEQIVQYTLQQLILLKHSWITGFKVSICSNGLLYMTPKVQNFFKKYSSFISFSISIDGNKELHDKCRLDLQGNGTYDRAIESVKHYRKHFGELLNTKMTVSPDNIDYLYDAIINLINEGYTEIFVNCVFEEGWNYSHAKILYEQLKQIADYFIINNLYDKIFMRFFSLDDFHPLGENDNKNWCGGCLSKDHCNFALDYKGDIYTCIRYMSSSLNEKQKPLSIGNIFKGYNTTPEQEENIQSLTNITRRSQSTDECFYCPIASGCAWCSAYNYEEFGTPNKRATYICCMHQAQSLANVYYWNKLYQKLNIDKQFKMYIPKEWALNIIDEDEYNYLLKLSN